MVDKAIQNAYSKNSLNLRDKNQQHKDQTGLTTQNYLFCVFTLSDSFFLMAGRDRTQKEMYQRWTQELHKKRQGKK